MQEALQIPSQVLLQGFNDTEALSLPSPVPFSFPGTKMSIFTRALSRGQALTVSTDGSDLSVFFTAEAHASRHSVPLNGSSVFLKCFDEKKRVFVGVQVGGVMNKGSD